MLMPTPPPGCPELLVILVAFPLPDDIGVVRPAVFVLLILCPLPEPGALPIFALLASALPDVPAGPAAAAAAAEVGWWW